MRLALQSTRECSVDGCARPVKAYGRCKSHDAKFRRYGDPLYPDQRGRRPIPLEARFWAKVEKSNKCWTWTGALDSSGYGTIWDGQRTAKAHRVAYEKAVGPIASGLQLDHLCRNRRCVRPSHLEPVTARENTLRGVGASAQNAVKTHCKRGHQFSSDNTLVKLSPVGNRWRYCAVCTRELGREYQRQSRKKRRKHASS